MDGLKDNIHAEHGGAFFDAIGPGFEHLERREQIVNADVLDAWYNPAPEVVEAIGGHLGWLIKTSPPTHGEGLIKEISKQRGIPEECVLLGSGSSSLIFEVLPQLVQPGAKVLILDPSYGEYEHLLKNVLHADIIRHELQPENSFDVDWDVLEHQVSQANLTILVNPNSPTGRVIENLGSLLKSVKPDAKLWVDETYIDYFDSSQSLERVAAVDPRVIVAKSMSKFFALSGLRVGYLAVHASLASDILRFVPPWPVGLLAQVAAVLALRNMDYYRQQAARTGVLRAELTAQLSQIAGVKVYPSVTNFIMFETAVDSGELVTRAMTQGVYLRNCDSMCRRFEGRFVRTAVKEEADNQRIAGAVAASL